MTLTHPDQEYVYCGPLSPHLDEPPERFQSTVRSEAEIALQIDLTQAIEAAYMGGNKAWVQANHPSHFRRLEARYHKAKPSREEVATIKQLLGIWGGSWVQHVEAEQDRRMQESVNLLRPAFSPNVDRLRETLGRMRDATPFSINAATATSAISWMKTVTQTALDELDKAARR